MGFDPESVGTHCIQFDAEHFVVLFTGRWKLIHSNLVKGLRRA
jgi:hypothetical protein